MIKVSVVVPIYGVERYIERCAVSLFSQTLLDVEFIFVNDKTKDDSIKILQSVMSRFPAVAAKVQIIHHTVNRGLPAARNTGLKQASGKYIYHCDSDDYLEPEMLQVLYDAAERQGADVTWCDWLLTFESNERYMHQPSFSKAEDALRAILRGTMKYNVWNKLVRRELYEHNHISFPEGYGMGEDMTMIRIMACAQTVASVPNAYYHYVKTNQEAFTNTFSNKHLEDIWYNTNETISFLLHTKGNDWAREIELFKLNVKYPFLISDQWKMYKLWKEWFPEANSYLHFNKQLSMRARLLQYMASKHQFWFVWLYFKLVYRFIYGILYR